jgi:hypothetical protein
VHAAIVFALDFRMTRVVWKRPVTNPSLNLVSKYFTPLIKNCDTRLGVSRAHKAAIGRHLRWFLLHVLPQCERLGFMRVPFPWSTASRLHMCSRQTLNIRMPGSRARTAEHHVTVPDSDSWCKYLFIPAVRRLDHSGEQHRPSDQLHAVRSRQRACV